MSWSPSRYLAFEAERNRPIEDLLARIPTTPVATAIDLGCGPGNSTELLRRQFPGARVSGLDQSTAMIEAARGRLPDIAFSVGDIAAWAPTRPCDVIFANAALQWVPDHVSLLPRLIAGLAPGGSLAVQVPDNLDEPSHRLMREVAADGPWADRLRAAAEARAPRHSAAWYFDRLAARASRVDLWRTTYFHPLAGAQAVVEWFRSTALRPYVDPLDEAARAGFLKRYRDAIEAAYPALADGTVLLPFPRLFFVATV